MWMLALGGLLLFMVTRSSTPPASGGTEHVDRNGIRWRIYESMPGFWCAYSDGYGGKWSKDKPSCGLVSYEQTVEMIEGNAAYRDPATGAIL